MTLTQLLNAPFRSAWIKENKITAHITKSIRLIKISWVTAKEQGKGHFSRFIKKILSLGYSILIEDIVNKHLVKILKRWGFVVGCGKYPNALWLVK